MFIFPTSLQFTKNFYTQFKNFFFADMPNMDSNKSMEEIHKYELLVPSKVLKKAQSKFKAKAKDNEDKLLMTIDKQNNQITLKSGSRTERETMPANAQLMLHTREDEEEEEGALEEKKQ